MQNPDDLPKIYQIQIKIKIKKGNYYIDRRELLEAIKKFISANENLEEYKKIYLASVENQ